MCFSYLVEECIEKGIKVIKEDTAETLRKKLSPKPAKPKK